MLHLAPDEKITLTIRKHWFIFLTDMFGTLLLLFLPFVVYALLTSSLLSGGPLLEAPRIDLALLAFLTSIWFLFIWVRLFATWTDYYLDVWIVTNERVIDVEQKGFFHRETSTFRINRIQDITVEIEGIIATFLNFGDVHVQTAGEGREFIIRGVARPKELRSSILAEIDKNDPLYTHGAKDVE